MAVGQVDRQIVKLVQKYKRVYVGIFGWVPFILAPHKLLQMCGNLHVCFDCPLNYMILLGK